MSRFSKRNIEMRGEHALVPLTRGHSSIIDLVDVERTADFDWHAFLPPNGGRHVYARARSNRRTLLLHRYLIGAPVGLQVDHINGDTLDNRRSNLRLATAVQNGANRWKRGDAQTSKFKGVCWNRREKNWRACICVAGDKRQIGGFRDEVDAARAYDAAALAAHGEFARLNFPVGVA